jgi:hypothetical protein
MRIMPPIAPLHAHLNLRNVVTCRAISSGERRLHLLISDRKF